MHETVYLSDPGSPLRIEYSQAAMELIRKRARDGLMAAPRIGMGVGGLLLGVREDARIRLLDSIDIPCSHSSGPSFNLTPDEKRQSREMIAEAGALSVSGKVGVIGWYCSKARGDAVLNESDLTFHAELFPGSGQVALVLRPSVLDSMRAAFFFRDENGAVVKAVECDVDEWQPAADADPAAAEPELRVPPTVVEISPPEPEAAKPAETKLSDIIGLALPDAGPDAGPAALPLTRSQLFGVPLDLAPIPRRRGTLPLILTIAAAVLLAGTAAFFTRDFWMPKPPLTLTTSELNGSLLIHWNPDAVRGIRHASMLVNDGDQTSPSVIALDLLELKIGLLSYTPKSKHVTAKLDAGAASAIADWFAPAPAPTPADASPPAATRPARDTPESHTPKTGR
jgi:hypothetical protein